MFLLTVAASVAVTTLVERDKPRAEVFDGPSTPSFVPVEAQTFDGRRQVLAQPTWAPIAEITARGMAGVVTSGCEGEIVPQSGQVAFEVDGRPRVFLSTSVPPFRDFRPGTRGDDVSALQAELGRLGYDVEATGVIDSRTRRAVKSFHADLGIEEPSEDLLLDEVIWIPSATMPAVECHLPLGSVLEPGGLIAETVPHLVELAVDDVGEVAALGPLEMVVGEVTGDLPSTGLIVDRSTLERLQPVVESVQAETERVPTDPVPVTIRLAEDIEVFSIPGSSVLSVNGSLCVVTEDDSPIPVEVIDSELGRTLVTGNLNLSTRIYLDPPLDARC